MAGQTFNSPLGNRARKFLDKSISKLELLNPSIAEQTRCLDSSTLNALQEIIISLKEHEETYIQSKFHHHNYDGETIPDEILEPLPDAFKLQSFRGQALGKHQLTVFYLNEIRRIYIECDYFIHYQAVENLNSREQLGLNNNALLTAAIFQDYLNCNPLGAPNLPSGKILEHYKNYKLLSPEQVGAAAIVHPLEEKRKRLSIKRAEERALNKELFRESREALEEASFHKPADYMLRLRKGRVVYCCKVKANACLRCPYNIGYEKIKSR